MSDIQQMFHSFSAKETHDYLHFLWFHNHQLVDYHIEVQVVGNNLSLAVAFYGQTWKAVEGESVFAAQARQFVEQHFCLDGSLKYLSTVTEAIDTIYGWKWTAMEKVFFAA